MVRECKVMGGHASTLVALASCFVSCGGVDGGCWVLGSREGEDAPFSPHTHEARTMVRSVIDSVLAQENTGEDSPELGELRALERTPVALDNPM